MALTRIVKPDAVRLERILIYGDPKTAKTRLATSLPDSFGEILYFAADPGAEALSSVIPSYRPRIHVVKSQPESSEKDFDPDKDAFTFALNDWTKEYPAVKTLIWDTLTATASDILMHIALTGQFSDRAHITIGSTVDKQNIPMQGDYMAAHNRIMRLLKILFRKPYHLLVLCHAAYDEPRDAGPAEGGPATVGKATVRSLGGLFDAVLHTGRKAIPATVPGQAQESKFMVYTERHNIWAAGIRSHHAKNPIPLVTLDPDPINFWTMYVDHIITQLTPVEAKS